MADDDRGVRRLMERAKKGKSIAFPEALALCPYRTLLGSMEGPPIHPDTVPSTGVAVLGFEPGDFCDQTRSDILADIQAGHIVLLISNKRELRDYAKREIALALSQPIGTA